MEPNKINKRPTKYNAWDENNLLLAVQYVSDGHSLREAAEVFRVPKSTLYDRVNRNAAHPGKRGGKPHLSEKDENDLCGYVKFMADAGAPISVEWLRSTAGRIADQR